MTVSVDPSLKKPTDHVSLSDGVTTLGLVLCDQQGVQSPKGYQRVAIPRSSIKMTQGEQEYSDLEPPWQDTAQKDWSGGRGSQVFDDNRTMYWDGHNVDTTKDGRIILGPVAMYATGVRNWTGIWPEKFIQAGTFKYKSNIYQVVDETTRYYGISFVPSANITTANIWLWVRKSTTSLDMTVHIFDNNAGVPGNSIEQATLTTDLIPDYRHWYIVKLPIIQALTAGTTYWVVLDRGTGAKISTLGTHLTDSTEKHSTNLSTWADTAIDTGALMFRLTDADKPYKAHFAILKNSLFTALEYLDYSDSKVFINGTQGTATAGAVGYLRDSNNGAITNDRFNGGMIYIWDGTGASSYNKIKDTLTTNSEIQVTPDYYVAPTTSSDYSVLDVDEFIEVTGIGTGSRVTDMLSVNGAIYFARGDGALIRRLRHYYSGATYFQWADESINTTMLEAVTNGTDVKIWAANRSLPAQIRVATGLDCTGTGTVAALTFGTAINVGDMEVKNTSILSAGESFPHLFVFKEDSICEIIQDLPYELRIAALKSVRDGWNGICSCVNDVYIYFNLGDRIQRYYKGQLDDITPVMSENRRGRPVSMLAYPGRLYVAYDGGVENYSTIMCYNGTGWTEIYNAPVRGERILNMMIQPIPGPRNVDRLWFSCGSDICWIPLVLDPVNFNELQESSTQAFSHHPYIALPYGYLETGWFYLGLKDLDKLFNALRVVTGQTTLDFTGGTVHIWYKTDENQAWTYVNSFETDVGDIELSATHNLTGFRIKFRIGLDLTTGYYSTCLCEVNVVVLEALETIPYRYVTDLMFRVADDDKNLLGTTPKDYTADQVLAKIREWGLSAGTVELKAYSNELGGTGRRVKVDPLAAQIINYSTELKQATYICTLRLYEVD